MSSHGPRFVLTYDVGGSHVSAGLCRLSDLDVLRVTRAPLPAADSFDSFVSLLHRLGVEAAEGAEDLAGAALAVPFPFDCEAGVSLMQHKLTSLYQRDLRGALARSFAWDRDRFLFFNDACAFLLGEVAAGSVKGAHRAAGLTLGTGIGSSFAIEGRCVSHGDGVPPDGEVWNLPYAGSTVEDFISTRALKADYLARTGRDREVADIAAAAATEDQAREVFAAFGQHLGEVLRDVIAPFRPDMVVIGGGISRSASLFLPTAERQITGLGFCVVQSALQDQAPLVGAAQHWRDEAAAAATQTSPAASASSD